MNIDSQRVLELYAYYARKAGNLGDPDKDVRDSRAAALFCLDLVAAAKKTAKEAEKETAQEAPDHGMLNAEPKGETVWLCDSPAEVEKPHQAWVKLAGTEAQIAMAIKILKSISG